jgi:hypothetical protein
MYLNLALAIRNCDFAEIMVLQNLLGIGMADLPTINEKDPLTPKHRREGAQQR